MEKILKRKKSSELARHESSNVGTFLNKLLLTFVALGIAGCGGGGGGGSDVGAVAAVGGGATSATLVFSVNAGSGSVTSTPGGLNCSSGACSAAFPTGTNVTLTATPNSNNALSGWGGGCAGTSGSICVVVMDSDLSADATFSTTTAFSVNISGSSNIASTVSSNSTPGGLPGNISCNLSLDPCTASFVSGASVTLTAHPAANEVFNGWSAGNGSASVCTGITSTSCTVGLASVSSITAIFAPLAPATSALTVSVAGGGTVSSAGGVTPITNCNNSGAGCNGLFADLGSVTLNATPSSGFTFTRWSGACTGTSSSCTFTKSASAQSTTAIFTATPTLPATGALTVNANVGGTVSSVGGVTPVTNCSNAGGVCNGVFNAGSLTLNATPSSGYTFTSWSGACSGSSTSCTFTKTTSAQTVTATFTAIAVPPPPSTTGALSVSANVGGTVSSVGGVTPVTNCSNAGGVCNGVFNTGSVTLNATPNSGYIFTSWSGACSGSSASCTFTKTTSAQTVTSTFTASPLPPTTAGGPVQLYTDITSGPTTGGENGKGVYLSVFGKGFGTAGMGTTVKMYINDVEVANYRYLGASHGRTDVQQLTAQVGSAGVAALTNGNAYQIKVIVGGQTADDPNGLQFTPNPGNVYFVSLGGSDTTGAPNDINKPYRTVQKAGIINNGTSGCPASQGLESVSTAGVWGLVQPGDVVVMRGGTWADTSKDNFFLRVQNKSGRIPTGAAGTGPITIMGYPGEDAYINRSISAVSTPAGGGISSADSARQASGCGAFVTLTNLRIESGMADGPINTQRGGDNPSNSHWRVVNNELTAISCRFNHLCKAAGVAGGGGGNAYFGNYIHDIDDAADGSTDDENHGFYIDSGSTGSVEIAYNRIINVIHGNGFQSFSSTGASVNNISFHHNIVNGTSKHCMNVADSSGSGIVIYDNVLMNCGKSGVRFNNANLSGFKFYNNTIFNILGSSPNAAIATDAAIPNGSMDVRNNIIVPNGSSKAYYGGTVGLVSADGTFTNNLYFNGAGAVFGTSNQTTNPLFVSATDLHLQAGSPAIDTGSNAVSIVVTTDYDIGSRPIGSGYDIGAYEQ